MLSSCSDATTLPSRLLCLCAAPRIITFLETLDVLMDHNATFICEVESRPPADVTWTKNNHPIMYVPTKTSRHRNDHACYR